MLAPKTQISPRMITALLTVFRKDYLTTASTAMLKIDVTLLKMEDKESGSLLAFSFKVLVLLQT